MLRRQVDQVKARTKARAPGLWRRATKGWMAAIRALRPAALARDALISRVVAARNRDAFGEVERFVMFVGYSRSGHSLVGSLLNAHPDVVIGHQLDALRYLRARFRREQLYAMLLVADRRYQRRGRTSNKGRFNYSVPDQWQGRVRRLRVIGDKRGESSTNALHDDPALLERLCHHVDVPVKLVHVVRNPYDNISTMAVRYHLDLPAAADRYFGLCAKTADLRREVPAGDWLDLRHEELISDTAASLRRLCQFLGVEADERYVADCAAIVYDRPHQSRREAPWEPGLIADVGQRMAGHAFLDGYAWDEPADQVTGRGPAGGTA